MLQNLHVKNLALIDEVNIEFGKGLNILSGETGAGKSVLLGSVNLALGEKTDRDVIRTGEEQALIELVFLLDGKGQEEVFRQYDIPVSDGEVILQRKIMENRSVCRVNGETVSQKQLREIAEHLIHIHGQRDNTFLLKSDKQRIYLDAYGKEELVKLVSRIGTEYSEYDELKAEYDELLNDEEQRRREIDLITYEVDELEKASLRVGEEEELQKKYKKMNNSRKILENVSAVYSVTGYEGEESAGLAVGEALSYMTQVSKLDEDAENLAGSLSEIDSLIADFNRELKQYMDSLSFDEYEFNELSARLDEIGRICAKYGNSEEGALKALSEKKEYLDRNGDFEAHKEDVRRRLSEKQSIMDELCAKVTMLRKAAAESLSAKLEEALKDLNFTDPKVRIDVRELDKVTRNGRDEIEFMISLNPGEPVKPLAAVASGGELSRIMLALRTIQAAEDESSTMIFDEIDSGISGRTAYKVSERLGKLAGDTQVICITHLPQIAAMSDRHFYIEKNIEEGRTTTTINELSEEESVKEIARMLGTDDISEAAVVNASELRKVALQSKNK